MAKFVSIGSGGSHLEWRLQGIVTVLNVAPVLSFAMGIVVFGFFSAIWLSILGWIFFGFLAFLAVLYAIFCLWTGTAVWQRKEWGLIGSLVIYLLYILVYQYAESAHSEPVPVTPHTSVHAVSSFSQVLGSGFHLLMLFNVIAFLHILVRWIRFRSSTLSN